MAFDWSGLFAGLKPEIKGIFDGPVVAFIKSQEDKIGSEAVKDLVEGLSAVVYKEIDSLLS